MFKYFYSFSQNEKCCNYGANGDGTEGYDCLLIPGASRADSAGLAPPGPNTTPAQARRLQNSVFCGRSAGLVTTDNAASVGQAKTICCEVFCLFLQKATAIAAVAQW